jgi:glycosyltransferase involved in cell wall biosynthesis
MRLVINGAFRGQTITGQQRYATEISQRLDARELALPKFVRHSKFLSFFASQLQGMRLRRGEVLLSLTSRGPAMWKRQIVVVHDLFVLSHPEWYSRLYVLSHAFVLRAQMRFSVALVCVSEPVAAQVRTLVGEEKRILVAPNAPSNVFFADQSFSGAQSILDSFQLRASHYVLAVGSQDPRKNADRLRVAYASLSADVREDFPLVFVGGSDATVFGTQIESKVGRSLGYVADAELATLYSQAALVVFVSIDEGFGLPAVEALAAGASLLVSDIPVFKWVCREHAEYVNPLDIRAIASSMEKLVSRELAPAERLKRRDYVKSRFTWEESARKISDLGDSLEL